jgi:hypothetical protein
MQMNKRVFFRFAAAIACAICLLGCSKRESSHTIRVFDTLSKGKEVPVHVGTNVKVDFLSAENFEGICLSIARTPGINHEIQAVSVFPDRYRPMVACVQTGRDLVYLCQTEFGEWHTFRISGYVY